MTNCKKTALFLGQTCGKNQNLNTKIYFDLHYECWYMFKEETLSKKPTISK